VNVKDFIDGVFSGNGNFVGLLLIQTSEQKVTFAAKVSQALQDKGVQAGSLVKSICALLDGNGGGRPDFAQGGGKSIEKADMALSELRKLLTEKLA
jgi:alanyl-tRNA synthetase